MQSTSERNKRKSPGKWNRLRFLAMAFAVWLGILIEGILFTNAEKLGYFFLPLALGVLAVTIFATAKIRFNQLKRMLRFQFGDDFYYERFPKEKIKDDRRAARKQRREEQRRARQRKGV